MYEKIKKDVFWVEKVIKSCKNSLHLDVAENCVDTLIEKWGNIPLNGNFDTIYLLKNEKFRLKSMISDLRMDFLKKNIDIYHKN